MFRMLSKLNLTRKKTLHPDEKEWERVQKKRREFWQLVQGILAKDLIFIDESGIDLSLTRLYARAPRGGWDKSNPSFSGLFDGKLGILVVNRDKDEAETSRLLQSQGIHIIHHYPVTECTEESDRIVLEFLQGLSQA